MNACLKANTPASTHLRRPEHNKLMMGAGSQTKLIRILASCSAPIATLLCDSQLPLFLI
ncbi:uncharacterized protein BKA55DRAFT_581807 [Fusarium redolens]|uniref:Uncharacterized protein n=1 Tax=Fusarium redolens TaxID=48865 RepID=A0A9P9G228_FUSRE|nr:uncharacterized protein BKA55DRAFT_581807 [Fusarium redolens]KAH7231790.1 hypothetical protein BKA55DRAFT_581807 [Fusarium redolens]